MSDSYPARIAADALLRPLRGRRRPPPVGEPRRLRLTVAYDGSGFRGWQRQRELLTVQELLEAAAERATGVPGAIFGAGRTDAGVHAEGQVAILDTRTALPARAVEALFAQVLPPSVRVRAVREVGPDWNPQRLARSKLYRYTILRGAAPSPARERAAWRLAEPLDTGAMRAAGALLVGTHDFRSFRTDPGPKRRDEGTVRTITSLELSEALDQIRIEVRGPGFLYMMVRNITAALVEVGRGRRPPQWVADLLDARDRTLLPPPAPAPGLCLVVVDYEPGPEPQHAT